MKDEIIVMFAAELARFFENTGRPEIAVTICDFAVNYVGTGRFDSMLQEAEMNEQCGEQN